VQGEAVRCRQQYLEEDKQVEQVAGEEGTVQADQQELQQRLEVSAAMLPAAQRMRQQGQRQHAGQQHHQGGKPIGYQHDAELRRPVANPVHRGERAVGRYRPHQRRGQDHQHHARDNAQQQHRAPALFADQQLQRCHQQWRDDRQDGQVAAHGVPSSPST